MKNKLWQINVTEDHSDRDFSILKKKYFVFAQTEEKARRLAKKKSDCFFKKITNSKKIKSRTGVVAVADRYED